MIESETMSVASIDELVRQYEDAVAYGRERMAAEYAYALADRLKNSGRLDEAREYARRSLHYAERLPSETIEDVTSENRLIGGVQIPELFHDDVVRTRLGDLLFD